jgi:hypothetical protein
MKPAIPVIRYFAMQWFPEQCASQPARSYGLDRPSKSGSYAKRVPELSAFSGKDSGGDGLSETNIENITPAQRDVGGFPVSAPPRGEWRLAGDDGVAHPPDEDAFKTRWGIEMGKRLRSGPKRKFA